MSEGDAQHDKHVLNERWKWSDAVTEFVAEHLEGKSLKVCTGFRPICDVNVDILDLGTVAERSEAADYTVDSGTGRITPTADGHWTTKGVFEEGDMFDLPFEDGTFRTVVSDPPWRELSKEDRKRIFEECVRVTSIGGLIIYNATWVPEDTLTAIADVRIRQEKQFWGCPSFLTFARKYPGDPEETASIYDQDLAPRRLGKWEQYHEQLVLARFADEEALTDPRFVDPANEVFGCLQCGCARLWHMGCGDSTHQMDGVEALYECAHCGFRNTRREVMEQARGAVEERAESENQEASGREPVGRPLLSTTAD